MLNETPAPERLTSNEHEYACHEIEEKLYQNDPEKLKKIKERYSGSGENKIKARKERTTFWQNVARVISALKDRNFDNVPLVGDEHRAVTILKQLIAEVTPPKDQFKPLNEHLSETTEYAAGLYQSLALDHSTDQGLSTDPTQQQSSFLESQDLQIIAEVITPLHDLAKHLGSHASQVASDHQVVMAYLLETYGLKLGLEDNQATFAADVIRDHENDVVSRHYLLENEDNKINQAKALFFLIDAFTGYVNIDPDTKEVTANAEALNKRFNDILLRWNDNITSKDIDPNWALTAILDFLAGMTTLEKLGVNVDPSIRLAVIESAITIFNQLTLTMNVRKQDAEKVHKQKVEVQTTPYISPETFLKTIKVLETMRDEENKNLTARTAELLKTRCQNLIASSIFPDGEGFKLALACQQVYDSISDTTSSEFDSLDVAYQAFDIVAATSSIEMIFWFLSSPKHQEQILEFLDSGEDLTISSVIKTNNTSLKELISALSSNLHDHYSLTLGDRVVWRQTSTSAQKSLERRRKSATTAITMIVNIFAYLKNGSFSEALVPNPNEQSSINDLNFARRDGTTVTEMAYDAMKIEFNGDTVQSGGVATSIERSFKGETVDPATHESAKAAHMFWLRVKKENTSLKPMDTSNIPNDQMPAKNEQEDPALHDYDDLHPMLKQANEAAVILAREGLIEEIRNADSTTKAISFLYQIIKHISSVLIPDETQSENQSTDPIILAIVDRLSTIQHQGWLARKLTTASPTSTNSEGIPEAQRPTAKPPSIFSVLGKKIEDQQVHFQLWQTVGDTMPLNTPDDLQDIHITYKDLDLLPTLSTAINLFLRMTYSYLVISDSPIINEVRENYYETVKIIKKLKFTEFAAIDKEIEDAFGDMNQN